MYTIEGLYDPSLARDGSEAVPMRLEAIPPDHQPLTCEDCGGTATYYDRYDYYDAARHPGGTSDLCYCIKCVAAWVTGGRLRACTREELAHVLSL